MMRQLLATILLASTVFAGTPDPINPTPQTGASFYSQLKRWITNEIYNQRREQGVGAYFVVCGCLDHVGPGLTHTPDACIGYSAGYRVTENQAITYPDGQTCCVVLEQGTTGDITASDSTLWTRVPGTHYMLNCIGGGKAPDTGVHILTVQTSGGAVVNVEDHRPLWPVDTADITPGAITAEKVAPGLLTTAFATATANLTTFDQTAGEVTVVTFPAVTVKGGAVQIACTWGGTMGSNFDLTTKIKRDGVIKFTTVHIVASLSAIEVPVPAPTWAEKPPAGTYVYTITMQVTNQSGSGGVSGGPNAGQCHLIEHL